jgi:hypothetical protein
VQEKVIQEYLFEYLWLLHPSWERPTTSTHMEKTVTKDLRKVKLTKEETAGRIDIRYATAAGKHIVVELKKADVIVDVFTLGRQLSKYREAMLKTLREQFSIENPEVELIAVLGKRPAGPTNLSEVEGVLRPLNARWVTLQPAYRRGARELSGLPRRQRAPIQAPSRPRQARRVARYSKWGEYVNVISWQQPRSLPPHRDA